MIRMISLLGKHFVKGLEAGRSLCRGVLLLFLCPGADSSGHLNNSQFPRYEDTVCPLLVGLSIWRGEVPILEENRSEKLVICIFLLKTNRTTSQVFTV